MLSYTFDLGGTSIKGIKFQDQNVIERFKLEYKERTGTFQVDLKHALSLIHNLVESESETFNLGLSIPGIVDFKKQTVNSESAFVNFNIDIKAVFNDLVKLNKFIIDNDGKATCLGEYHFGIDKGKYQNIAMFTIGSGVGGAIILDSKIHRGSNGMAGEFSKLYSNLEGEEYLESAMFCGTLQGCYRYSMKKGIDFKEVSGISLMKACEEQESDALEILNNWTNSLSKLIMGINYVVDLDVAYIGGGVSANDLFTKTVIEKVKKIIEKEKLKKLNINLLIKPSSLKNDAACYGMLWNLESEKNNNE